MEVENKKIIIPSPVPFYESLVSVKENADKKLKKKKKRKEKKTANKLKAPRVMCNVKIILQ